MSPHVMLQWFTEENSELLAAAIWTMAASCAADMRVALQQLPGMGPYSWHVVRGWEMVCLGVRQPILHADIEGAVAMSDNVHQVVQAAGGMHSLRDICMQVVKHPLHVRDVTLIACELGKMAKIVKINIANVDVDVLAELETAAANIKCCEAVEVMARKPTKKRYSESEDLDAAMASLEHGWLSTDALARACALVGDDDTKHYCRGADALWPAVRLFVKHQ